jgi:O-antigen/teichoic acid export membrane protein
VRQAGDTTSLRRAAFSGSRWLGASLAMRGLVQIAQMMVLARLLAPADFGLMAVVGAMYAIFSLFVDLGLSNAVIHFPNPTRTALSTLYWLNLGSAAAIMLAFIAFAWLFAPLFRDFCVMAEKELRFRTLAAIELVAALCGFAAAVTLALLGGGAYALVGGSLATVVTTSLLAWLLLSNGLRPGFRFSLAEVKGHLRYGSYRLGDALFNSVQLQADVLIGGAVAGAPSMGIYTLPRNLALQLANGIVNPVVTRVALPVLAKVQDDRAALKSIYLQTLRMTSSVNFPIYAGLAVWSEEVVAIVFGNQWQQAATYLALFAAWGMIRSTGNPVGSLVYATGHVRRAFCWNLAQLLVVPALLWFGVSVGGTLGLAMMMLCIQVLIFYPLFRFLVQPACGAGFGEYIRGFLPALAASALAACSGLAASSLVPHDFWVRLVVGGAFAAAAYLASSWILNRHWVLAMLELLAPMLRRPR